MKVAVVGSRNLSVDIAPYIPSDCTEIISGGAAGIDALAEAYADAHRLTKHIFRPQYRLYGRGAPLRRNKQIVEEADLILAFWDGKSRGTQQTIAYAQQQGKEIKVILANDAEKTDPF